MAILASASRSKSIDRPADLLRAFGAKKRSVRGSLAVLVDEVKERHPGDVRQLDARNQRPTHLRRVTFPAFRHQHRKDREKLAVYLGAALDLIGRRFTPR